MNIILSKLQETVEEKKSVIGYCPWGHKDLDTTESLNNNKTSGNGRAW